MSTSPHGFTGKLASLSARRPWITVISWVLIIIAAGAIAALYPADLNTDFNFTNDPEAVRGERLLAERMDSDEPVPDEYVVVSSPEYTVADPEFEAFVGELQGQLMAQEDYVSMAGSYYQLGEEVLVSDDQQATILPVFLQDPSGSVHGFLDTIDSVDGEQGFEVVTGGFASINETFIETSERDLITGETIGVSMALIVLVVVFGTLVAAGIPLLMAIFAITISIGVTMIIGQFFDLSLFVINMMVMIGLAVGIDYSLFILGRYREERRKGFDKSTAIVHAGETASKAVFFSGLTVVIALFGMLIVPSNLFNSLGTGAIIVVVVSVLATLTLLPAILGLLGDRVDGGRGRLLLGVISVALLGFSFVFRLLGVEDYFVWAYIGLSVLFAALTILGYDPFHRDESEMESGRFWTWISRKVMGRPVISVVVVGLAMIALSAVYLTIELGESGIETLPEDSSSARAFAMISQRFSAISLESPNVVVIDAPDVQDGEVSGAIEQLTGILASDADFGPPNVIVNDEGNLAAIEVAAMAATGSSRSIESIERLRNEYIPDVFGAVDANVLVTGPSAYTVDFNQLVSDYTPIVFAFVLGMSFILLLLAFRSIVVPIKSVLMNLLSVGAAYGLLVAVFQHGVGNQLLGFQQVERIDAWVPLLMFTILFGLSMDYHVFLLSRVRERYDLTKDNTGSVTYGVRTTASMITGAALIMVAVFSGFSMGDLVMFQQMGFGLAVAVILDATVVRSVLVPASMKLLGDWNWYLPTWLRWLPEINVEGHSIVQTDVPVPASAVTAEQAIPASQPPLPSLIEKASGNNSARNHD
jgi:putative drug exporter of the RND superfamily